MRALRFIIALALAVAPASVKAAALGVSPVLFELPAAEHAAVLTIRDDGAQPINVQVRVFRWSQVDGVDQLTPTTDLVVSPPFSILQPRADQIVRVVRLKKTPVTEEESYRLLVDELPAVTQSGVDHVVTLLMRHSIPVFFEPDKPIRANVNWRLDNSDPKACALVANNTGARRLRIANLVVKDGAGHVVGEHKGLLGYILPGAAAHWPCPTAPGSAPPSRLLGDTDVGPLDASLSPSKP